MERADVYAQMDERIARGEREAREWLRAKRWLIALTFLLMVGASATTGFFYLTDPEGKAFFIALISLLLPLGAGTYLVDRSTQIRMEARRDAAIMEMKYANASVNAEEVEVGWLDRFRYAPRMVWGLCALYAVLIFMKADNILHPDSTWIEVSLDVLFWSYIGWLAVVRLIKQDKQEELTKARVMYREATEAGADLRGAFSLATSTSGDLEMQAERASYVEQEVAFDLDEDPVAAEVVRVSE